MAARLAFGIWLGLFAAASAAPQRLDARNSHLSAIPADASFVISVKIGELWKSDSVDWLRKMYSEVTPEMEKHYGLTPDDIERITVFGVPELDTWAVLITAKKPLPYRKLFKLAEAEFTTVKVGDKNVLRFEESWSGVHLIDDRTILNAHADVVQWLVQRGPKTTGPLADAILAAEANTLMFACRDQAGPHLREFADSRDLLKTMAGVVRSARSTQLTVNVTGTPRVSLQFDFADNATALKHKAAVADFRTAVLKELDERLLQLNPPPTPDGKPQENNDDSKEISVEIVTRAFGGFHDEIKKADLVLDGPRWKTEFALPGKDALSSLYFMMFSTHLSELAQEPRETPIMRVGKAIMAYEADHGHLPPRAIFDKKGNALLSWRVLILPYLGEAEAKLHKEFKLDEPWDGPHNIRLVRRMPAAYFDGFKMSDRQEEATTRIQAFTGPDSLFQGTIGRLRKDIKADPAKAVLFGNAGKRVPWSKPADLEFVAGKLSPNLQPNSKDNAEAFWRTDVGLLNGLPGQIPSNMTFPEKAADKQFGSSPSPVRVPNFDEQLLKPYLGGK